MSLPMYRVENGNLPSKIGFGPSYKHSYLVAARSPEEAFQLAREQSGKKSWILDGLLTKWELVGTSLVNTPQIIDKPTRIGEY